MDSNFSLIFDYVEENYGIDHLFTILYVLNLIFGAIAFKLGFARKLPILKSLFVYMMLAIGTFIITIFSIFKMPMTESLIIISAVLGVYRFRLHQQRKARTNNEQSKTP
ncbi:YlaH-like family protein [Lentibacillus sp. Marseille-P4043]|uniref:YlaH-like family protein n=1 Tax=Lentibacillus sp. Marseille-P4043 TaxID=2040293 RepID=UPI000D0B2329|nr:YlaH-like family protein [Lentibacillus sp. Marseille-P4043]